MKKNEKTKVSKKKLPEPGTRVHTGMHTKAQDVLMAAKSLEQFFNALHPFLLAPKYKVFKATKFSSSNGRHTQGEYVVDKNTKPLYFYFGDRFKERFEVAKEVRAYLVEHLPKRGAHLMQVDAGFLAFDYRYVTTYSDHFSSEHEIQIVATVVRSESSFLSTTKQ